MHFARVYPIYLLLDLPQSLLQCQKVPEQIMILIRAVVPVAVSVSSRGGYDID